MSLTHPSASRSWHTLNLRVARSLHRSEILASRDILSALQNESSPTCFIAFGHLTEQVTVAGRLSGEKVLCVSPALIRRLRLPVSRALKMSINGDTIRLGPIVGLMTISPVVDGLPHFARPFLMAGARRGDFFCTFSPSQVKSDGINALWLECKEGRYVIRRQHLPFPDVVYERIPSRTLARDPWNQSCIAHLRRQPHLKMFNQGYFNKWEIHQLLSQDATSAPYLPETRLATFENITLMLKKYPCVYLKPIHGTLGLGIVRIRKVSDGYLLDSSSREAHSSASFRHLRSWYARNPNIRSSRYLVQQGIPLLQYQGGQVDFRSHLQRDGSGVWQIIAIGAKVSRQGSITTHIRTGGHFFLSNRILNGQFGDQAAEIDQRLQEASLQLADALSRCVHGPLGELGLDIGVDTGGNIWMFEANAKPGRSIFKEKEHREAGKRSVQCLLDYARYLSLPASSTVKSEVSQVQ